MKYVLLTITILTFTLYGRTQDLELFKPDSYVQKQDTLLYRILWPEDFDETKKYPLLIFLHGAGERGNDNKKQLVHGAKLFLSEQNRSAYPAIVLFPQCPRDDFWSNVDRVVKDNGSREFTFSEKGKPNPSMKLTMRLLKSMVKKPYVDKDRVYVGGLSMGGMGTFELVSRMPKLFAAAFPICGGGSTEAARKYADKVQFWIFHGGKDNVVLPRYSLLMVEAIRSFGGNPKFTLYPEANHNSWDRAFAEPELLPWLFSQTK